jgi:hypothetical protein
VGPFNAFHYALKSLSQAFPNRAREIMHQSDLTWPVCHTQVKLLRSDIARSLKAASDDAAVEQLLRAKAVAEGHGPGGDLRKLLKQPTPALLKLLLGNQCNLVTLQVEAIACRPSQGDLSEPTRCTSWLHSHVPQRDFIQCAMHEPGGLACVATLGQPCLGAAPCCMASPSLGPTDSRCRGGASAQRKEASAAQGPHPMRHA